MLSELCKSHKANDEDAVVVYELPTNEPSHKSIKERGEYMNLLFWNLKRNNIKEYIVELMHEKGPDVAIFSEYGGINLNELEAELNGEYICHNGNGGCEKVTMMAKKSVLVNIYMESHRYTIYSVSCGSINYNVIGIHLSAKPYADEETRKAEIRDLVGDIHKLESKQNNSNTIVIGDFNANPFDKELIQKDTFNAVLFKELILKKEYDTWSGKRYRRFYDPMLDYISEDNLSYGTYYYSGGSSPMYWNCFDQVVVRKPLANKISNIEFCKTINGKRLLANFKPQDNISDHLPLFVQLERNGV